MDLFQDDRYLVFIRLDPAHTSDPQQNEEPLAECGTYEEARRIKHQSHHDCVIRFRGCVGGGD